MYNNEAGKVRDKTRIRYPIILIVKA